MKAFAPYRVSLFGGGTDYPEWYMRNGGIAVNFTMDRGIRVEVEEEKDELTRVVTGSWVRYVRTEAGLGRETGMGGSAAYAVALLLAKRGYGAEGPMGLAMEAYRAERAVGRTVGVQDHLAAAHGGCNAWWFRKETGEIEREGLGLSEEQMGDLCKRMMLLPVPRQEAGSGVAARYAGEGMERTYSKAMDGLRALRSGNWEKVGYELDRAWREKKRWARGVSTVRVDEVIECALRVGAWGAKLCGAGAGGMVLVMAQEPKEVYRRMLGRGYTMGHYTVGYTEQGARVVEE